MTNKVLGLVGLATRAGKVIFGTDACVEGIEKIWSAYRWNTDKRKNDKWTNRKK